MLFCMNLPSNRTIETDKLTEDTHKRTHAAAYFIVDSTAVWLLGEEKLSALVKSPIFAYG